MASSAHHRLLSARRCAGEVSNSTRARTLLAWGLWLATFGCCAAGLAVTLAVTRPLTIGVLGERAAKALVYPLGMPPSG